MKKNISFTTIIVLLLLCMVAPISASGAEPQAVATVVALRGAVVAQNKAGASRNLSIKSQIFQEDELKTGPNGQLQIIFTDNTIISLGRGSEMKIAEYRWQPERKDGALRTQAKEGTFRVMGGALAKDAPQNVKTETPTATIGIRGSMYTFKATKDSLSIVFQGGKGIEIYNDLGKVTITVPGFGTRVMLNAPPAKPAKFTEQDIKDLNSQLNGGGANGNGATNGAGPGSASGEGETESTSTGTDTTTSTQPLAETILPAPAVPPPPVLPPANELPTAPAFPPPPAPPGDGIYAFKGGLGGTSTKTDGSTDTFINDLYLGVNWYNRKIFGVAFDNTVEDGKPVFFFGSVNGSTVSDIKIFGADKGGSYQNDDDAFISGSGSGLFTGSAYDFFSFIATGSSFLIKGSPTQTLLDSWTVAGGAQQVVGEMVPTAPKGGSEIWSGFVVGVSENMNDRPTDRHLIYNTNPNSFTMNINKDAGTILGTLTTDSNIGAGDANYNISGMTVGGSYGSVYLNDQLLAALLGGSAGITAKEYGNYMVVDPKNQISPYFTWGYWEVAYVDPTNSTIQRQIRVPESLWLAGKPSNNSVIKTGFVGTYNGKAFGTMINTNDTTQITQVSGSMNLTADFVSTPSITGSLAFTNGPTLTISGGAFSADSLTNQFSAGLTGGNIQGAFYGPNAEAVGGNFYSLTDDKQYIGIFGGNR